jgi:histidinol-phosphate aminotransferase
MRETTLRLDANEGRSLIGANAVAALLTDEILRRYPDARPLEETIAKRMGLPAARVLATAGADDAIDRAVRAFAGSGGTVVSAEPSFVEYAAAAARSGARFEARPRAPGSPYPLGPVIEALEAERAAGRRALAIVCSPDNPGGTSTSAEEIGPIAAVGFPVLLDVTYAAFACEAGRERIESKTLAYALPPCDRVVTTASLSKAYGLAGLRVGWACGPEDLIERMRESGPPYSLSSVAVAAGAAALEANDGALVDFIAEVRRERTGLEEELATLGARTWAGEANFASAFVADAAALSSALAADGVLVRTWPGCADRANFVRITCPGEAGEYRALVAALRKAKEYI